MSCSDKAKKSGVWRLPKNTQSELWRIPSPNAQIAELLKFNIGATRQQTESSVLSTSPDSVDRIEVASSSGCSAIRAFLAKFLHWFETRYSAASLSHAAAAQPGTKVTMATGDPAASRPFSSPSAQHFITKDAPPTGFTQRMPTSIREPFNRSARICKVESGRCVIENEKSVCQSLQTLLCLPFCYLLLLSVYLSSFSVTPEALSKKLKSPENRSKLSQQACEAACWGRNGVRMRCSE